MNACNRFDALNEELKSISSSISPAQIASAASNLARFESQNGDRVDPLVMVAFDQDA